MGVASCRKPPSPHGFAPCSSPSSTYAVATFRNYVCDLTPAARLGESSVAANPNNRRVRPAPAWTELHPVTLSQLTMKREGFWGSQSSGRPVVWSNLKVAAEAMLNGDVELANTVLDAADIRVPNSDLSICYDALGQVGEAAGLKGNVLMKFPRSIGYSRRVMRGVIAFLRGSHCGLACRPFAVRPLAAAVCADVPSATLRVQHALQRR